MKKSPSSEEKIAPLLIGRRWSLALAESCTGGLIGHKVTAVPGSSRYFRGGVVAYDNAVKEKTLGVKKKTLEAHGAVSAETAVEMAKGARRLFGASAGLAVTGIAGPGGGTREKPVGLVYAAVAAGRRTRVVEGRFRGGRETVRRRAAEMALNLLSTFLDED